MHWIGPKLFPGGLRQATVQITYKKVLLCGLSGSFRRDPQQKGHPKARHALSSPRCPPLLCQTMWPQDGGIMLHNQGIEEVGCNQGIGEVGCNQGIEEVGCNQGIEEGGVGGCNQGIEEVGRNQGIGEVGCNYGIGEAGCNQV